MEGQGLTRQNERDPTPPANAITPDTDCQTLANMIVAELESIDMSDETPVKASTNERKIEESAPTASKAGTADARNERETTAAAQANAEAVFLDHDTLARIIAAKLHDYNISPNLAVKVSTIEGKIDETVSIAFRSAMANFFHKPAVDVTALRVQTLGSFPHSPIFRTRAYTDRPHSQHRVPLRPDDLPERPDSTKTNLFGAKTRHHSQVCQGRPALWRFRGPHRAEPRGRNRSRRDHRGPWLQIQHRSHAETPRVLAGRAVQCTHLVPQRLDSGAFRLLG